MITRNFKLFLTAGRSIPLLINANQYDHGETWIFTLYDETGQKYTPSSGGIVGIKSDGYVIADTGTVNSAGQVVIIESEQMTAAAGKAIYELVIDDQTHGTANFCLMVEPKPGVGGIVSDSDLALIQQALDSTSPAAIAQGVSDWMDDNLAPEEWVIDSSLSVAGAAADAKKTGDEISDLKSQISDIEEQIEGGTGSGLTEDIKQALMALVNHVTFDDDDPTGQAYIDALQSALYPPANLVSISAVYTQGETVVYDTDSLDDLKTDLVVTAHYDDSSTETVNTYVLSGTLVAGTSTITVNYGGKSTTFTVTVTHYTVPPLYSWDFTSSLTDSIQGAEATTDATLTEGSGISLSADNQYIGLGAVYNYNRTYEFTVTALNRTDNTNHRRIFAVYKTASGVASYARGFFYAPTKGGLCFYLGSWSSAMSDATIDNCDGKFAIYVDSTGKMEAYRNGVYLGTSSGSITKGSNYTNVYIGGDTSDKTRVKVTSYKIYEGKVID